MEGKIKWYNKEKGYGFITADTGEDVFLHRSDVRGMELADGERVQFDIGEGPKGKKAINLMKMGAL